MSKGHRRIGIHGAYYLAHRLAWFWVHGVWPNGMIDHINGDPDDNRIANIRDVLPRVNRENVKCATKGNRTTGVLGVRRSRRKFYAEIRVKGKRIHLGMFDDMHSAYAAYVAAKRQLHEGCTL
jgi:AP2 domain.